MRKLVLPILMVAALPVAAQPAAPPPFDAPEPETVHSEAERNRSIAGETVQAVLDPVYGVDGQYARWKHPICFNVYGLAPTAKYVIERRMAEIARQVGAPVERRDPCVPNVTVVFTTDVKLTLDSINTVRQGELLPDYDFIRMRLKQSQPVQAWYGVSAQGADGRGQLQNDALNDGDRPPVIHVAEMSRLNTGISTALETVVIVADTSAVMGKTLGTLADYFALLALAQARDTSHCKDVPSIANLMYQDCDQDYRALAITNTDLAMLTGLYRTSDNSLQVLQRQRIMGAMKRNLDTRQGP